VDKDGCEEAKGVGAVLKGLGGPFLLDSPSSSSPTNHHTSRLQELLTSNTDKMKTSFATLLALALASTAIAAPMPGRNWREDRQGMCKFPLSSTAYRNHSDLC
jgi:hypothetical protein